MGVQQRKCEGAKVTVFEPLAAGVLSAYLIEKQPFRFRRQSGHFQFDFKTCPRISFAAKSNSSSKHQGFDA